MPGRSYTGRDPSIGRSQEEKICQYPSCSQGRCAMPSTRAKKAIKTAPKARAQKWVYLFAGGKAEGNAKMRALLGGKEAGAGTLGSGGARPRDGRTIHEEAPRRPEGPAARLRALGFRDVNARDDGHGP